MTMPTPSGLPDKAWFVWQGDGKRYELVLVRSTGGYPDYYDHICPKCGHHTALTHLPGKNHTLTVAPDGALTATPSLKCPHFVDYNANPKVPCNFHTVITNGVGTAT